jgi:hypothetical protein
MGKIHVYVVKELFMNPTEHVQVSKINLHVIRENSY